MNPGDLLIERAYVKHGPSDIVEAGDCEMLGFVRFHSWQQRCPVVAKDTADRYPIRLVFTFRNEDSADRFLSAFVRPQLRDKS